VEEVLPSKEQVENSQFHFRRDVVDLVNIGLQLGFIFLAQDKKAR
jgi:hypothetical protein